MKCSDYLALLEAMSRATRQLEHHLERLLKELQSDSTPAVCGALGDVFPPASDSAGVDGSCDPLGKETTASSQVSGVSNSESDDASTSSGCNCGKYYLEETAKLVQQLGDSRVQVATLEAHIEFLTTKVEESETLDSLYIQRLEEEVLRLEGTVGQEVSDLGRRQNEGELKGPSLEEQFKTIKDFDVSEILYVDLKSIPEQRRTAREHILILAYEKFLRDREEIQELRISRDTSREALTRANDEVQRLTDELHRVAANNDFEHGESELDLSSKLVLIEQLEAERHDSRVQIEVLSAKCSFLDDVQGKLEKLQSTSIDAENENADMAATLQVALQEKESLRGSIVEKDHNLDLLSMDKTYLSREVESLKDQVRKLESELERQHKKLQEVKRERTELRKDSLAANEQFQAEIFRIKENTNESLELNRRESNAIADEKLRIFRELRDEAMAAAEMCRTELRESKAAYEELLSKYRELRRVADSKEAESQRNLTWTNCELDQLKVVLAETKNSLDQTRLENEALIVKLKAQTQKLSGEKTALETSLLEIKEDLKITRDQLEFFQRAEAAKLESLEREKAKSFSAWRDENINGSEDKLKSGVYENQLFDQPSRVTREKERVPVHLHSVQGDIIKLLRARGSVDHLQSLLNEKGAPLGGSRSNFFTKYSRSSLVHTGKQAVSPRISNLDHSASPTRRELQTIMEHGETLRRCHQHRACRPHYPKAYEKLVDAMSRKAPAPFSQVPASASLSSAPAPSSPSSPAPTPAPCSLGRATSSSSPEPPPAPFTECRNSCS